MAHTDEKLYEILLSVKEDIGEMKSDIKNVVAQTTKTNGRVTALESIVSNWQGRIAILSLFVGSGSAIIISWVKNKLGL